MIPVVAKRAQAALCQKKRTQRRVPAKEDLGSLSKTEQCEQDDGDMCGHPRTSNTK